MKYLYYIFVLFTVIIRRVISPFIFAVIPFREKLRHNVYAYSLKHNKFIKRLYERNPRKSDGYWFLDGTHHGIKRHGTVEYPEYGMVKDDDVSVCAYYISLVFWLLLDDDCNEDTYDKGFNRSIFTGSRKRWLPKFVIERLLFAYDKAEMKPVGNSFDLGDSRGKYPLYEFWSVLLWTLRNPAYNFNYKFNQINNEKLVFQIVVFNRLFGWKEDGLLNGVKTYSWEFGIKDKK